MALVSLKGGILWPDMVASTMFGTLDRSASSMLAGQQLNAAGSKLAFIFICPPGGMTVHSVKFQVPTKATNGNCDVRLETVSASDGNATGTLVATNTNGTASITATGLQTVTLTADATLSAGTLYALVFARSTGDYFVSTMAIATTTPGAVNSQIGAYVRYASSGGTYASRTLLVSHGHAPVAALLDASGNYYYQNGFLAVSAYTKSTFNNTSNPKERGAALVPRVPMRVAGWYAAGQMMNGDTNVVLSDTGGSAILTFTGDKDWGSAYSTGSNYGTLTRGYFSSTADLTAGTTYYLTLQPSSATDCNLHEVSIIDTSDVNGFQAFNAGADCKLVTRASGGSYTVSSTARPFSLGLIISHLDDGSGGGGGGSGMLYVPGMNGGVDG